MIYLYPTYTKITNYDANDCPKLEKSLSVWNPITYSYNFSAFLLDEDNREIIIPSGYDVNYLKTLFPNVDIVDKRKEVTDYKTVSGYALLVRPRDEVQKDAIEFLLGEKGLINPQKYLSLQTGQGKTYCVINYCYKTKKLPMIVVDQETLLQQWKESILKFTSLMENQIYIISGKPSIDKLYKMSEKELSQYKYFIAIHRTLSTMFDRNPEDITKLFEYLGIGVKVYDEAHIEYYNIFYIDCVTKTETIYLSATPQRSSPNEQKVYKNMFYSVPLHKSEVVNKYLNVMLYSINTKCSQTQQIKFRGKRGFDILAYSKYFIDTDAFESTLIDLLNKIFKKDFTKNKKIAIIYKMKDHLKIAKSIIEDFLADKEHNLTIGILDGDTKNKEAVKQNNIIITTDSSFTKGVDVENLEIMINFVPTGTTSKLNQLTGRLRYNHNLEVFFIDVIDESVDGLVNMSKLRTRFYKKMAKRIYTMNGIGCVKQ